MSRTRWAIGMVCGLALAASAQNTNGTWTFNGSDFWTVPGRWSGNNIASGIDATGNFATIDISDHRVVTLTNQITIGHMLFGDVGGGGSHQWRLTNNIVDYGGGNVVTGSLLLSVSAGVPTIWVTNQTLHLGARLDGT